MIKYPPFSEKRSLTSGALSLTTWQLQTAKPDSAIIIAKGVMPADDQQQWRENIRLRFFCPEGQTLYSQIRQVIRQPNGFARFDEVSQGDMLPDYWLQGFDEEWVFETGSFIKASLYKAPFVYRNLPLLVFVNANDDCRFSDVLQLVTANHALKLVDGHFSRAPNNAVHYIPQNLLAQGIRPAALSVF